MIFAKQSTAKSLLVGPVLDSTGAAKTDEVVGNLKATKNGSVGALDGSATLIHSHSGKYVLALSASDTDALGVLEISLNDGTNDMPVVRLNVLPAEVYDSLVGGTDYPTVAAISSQVAADLAAAHGAGSWATATGFALASVWTPQIAARLDVAVSSRLAAAGYAAPDNASVAAIKAKTDQLSFAGGDVRATLDGESMVLGADERSAIADAVLGRDVSYVEDSAPEHSLAFVVLAMSESNTLDHAGWLTVYKTDGTQEFIRKELLTGQDVQAVTGIR